MDENGWHRIDEGDLPDEGRVQSLVVDGRAVALTRSLAARQRASPTP
jgi:hypothetical protein